MSNSALHTDSCTPNHGSFKADRYEFNVTLSNGAPAKIVGYLYYHGSFHNRTLLVSVHGGTYDQEYWNAPTINGRSYSFACNMAPRKYAILALTMLGTPESSGNGQIDGDFLSVDEVRGGLSQVMGQLRSGHNPIHECFNRIVLVGHSLGSLISLGLQAQSHPADGLIVTGWGHVPPAGGSTIDPSLIFSVATTPYFKFPEPVRQALFYGPSADPAMIAYDSSHMSHEVPRALVFTSFSTTYQPSLTGAAQVTGKVLVQLGENDALFPASGAAGEPAAYPHASVTVQSLPTTGHDVNLHPENTHSWDLMDSWLKQNRLD